MNGQKISQMLKPYSKKKILRKNNQNKNLLNKYLSAYTYLY